MAQLHLIRHGESLGNDSQDLYNHIPNHAIPLTEKGTIQAYKAGKELAKIFDKNPNVTFIVSPFKRTRDTLTNILEQFPKREFDIREEALVSEIDYGLFDGIAKDKRFDEYPKQTSRYKFICKEKGIFWARYPEGESPFDVEARITPIIEDIKNILEDNNAHVVIVSHSTTLRVLMKRLLNLTPEDYMQLNRMGNCDIITLEYTDFDFSFKF